MQSQRIILYCLFGLLLSAQLTAVQPFVTTDGSGFAWITNGKSLPVLTDSAEYPGVVRAINNLCTDAAMVTDVRPAVHNSPQASRYLIIGSLQQSQWIQELARKGMIPAHELKDKHEKYLIQTLRNPLPGIEEAVVIAGSDKRGAIYGIYELAAQMGVSPWYYWADVPVQKHASVGIQPGVFTDGEPAVKYRGIFLNDEAPALTGWAREAFGGLNSQFYEKVFELILRLKGNFLWPAMWNNAFYDDDPLNGPLADEMGIVMGTTHHEPMGQAQQDWKRRGAGPWDYNRNDKTLRDFWAAGVKRSLPWESLLTVGMRGDGDEPMSEQSNIALLKRIVSDQRKIIEKVTGRKAEQTPQVWALYKEVQEYYDKGMRVPDDITLLLCDDNWGNVRKLPALADKPRKGGYGMYYHFDYVGGPRNSKWLNITQVQRTWEQMALTWEHGVRELWIVNVGDLKPMEYPITFWFDMAWNPQQFNAGNLLQHTEGFCAQQFGSTYAREAARLIDQYTRYNRRIIPELLNENTYSLHNYNEWERVKNEYRRLSLDALKLYYLLPKSHRDAFDQLVLFPIQACANLYEMYHAVAMNHALAAQGNSEANEWAQKAQACYERDSLLSYHYNKVMSGGKWNHMMDQTHIGYTYWQQPEKQVMPQVKLVPEAPLATPLFVEKDGYVSIEAEHYTRRTDGKAKWTVIPGLGRTLSGVTTRPSTEAPDEAMALEYDVHFATAGEAKVIVRLSATLNYNDRGLRYAVSFDGGEEQIVNFNGHYRGELGQWQAEHVIHSSTDHRIDKAGKHSLRFRALDPGIVLQKILIDRGGLKPSWLGAPESERRQQAEAKLRLPALISDGMVVQRGQPVKLWGTAKAGESIQVKLAGQEPAYTTTAGAQGDWSLTLPAMQAGGPYTLQINELEVKDVWVGDVWLCSGQSNMELPISRVTDLFAGEVKAYDNPQIRYLKVPYAYDFHSPQSDIPREAWKTLTQENVMGYAALCYFFAKAMYEKNGIPIGLINASWGGTPVEAWISEEGLREFPLYLNDKRRYEDDNYIAQLKQAEGRGQYLWDASLYQADTGLHEQTPWYADGYDDSGWEQTSLFAKAWAGNGLNPVNGSHWFRRQVEIPAAWEGQEAVLRLGCIVNADSVYVNGVFVGTTSYQYPPRIYPLPAGLLKAGKNTVTIRLISKAGYPQFVEEKPYKLLCRGEAISLEGEWKHRTGAIMPTAPSQTGFNNKATGLYNGMIAPLLNYTVKGVIWYQGESNVSRRNEYAGLLTALIADWRTKFNTPELPFYIIELAGFLAPDDPGRKGWEEMQRIQQQAVEANAHTKLIRNSDLGEWNDIHPLDKKTLGYRVADSIQEDMEPSLKQALGDKFLVGVAINSGQAAGRDTAAVAVIRQHFNAIVPENCMKSAIIHPEEGRYDFRLADEFVQFGEANNLFITGHCLIWHSQLAPWFCVDEAGNDVSPSLLKERMKEHIHTIVGRYKGRVKGWDVVNEAILENGEWRNTPFYRILGEEFIPLAFQYAHEADPEAELYYNDYDMSFQGRRESVVKLINTLRERGIRIDAVGMQGHLGMDYPAIGEFEESLLAFAATGVKVMITEWDMSALPTGQQGANIADTTAYGQQLNLYPNGLPNSVSEAWNSRMNDFLRLFIKHADVITRVTAWGVSDGDSWKNNWPVRGRRDYALLFDRNYQPKPFIAAAMRPAKEMRYLVPGDYMADPAVHVFNDKLYIYPSHDWESGIPENDNGDHFNMKDYHVFSTGDVMQGEITDHGVVLAVEDVPWAGRQLWDNDVARKDGMYYLYFSMKDKDDVFRIGVAVSSRPEGPFVPQAGPVTGSYSIDPAVLDDGDGNYYLYFGGLWGGQLQRYRDNKALESEAFPAGNEPALPSRVVKLSPDMLGLAEDPRPVVILDESGEPIQAGDNQRRFFEASWMHKYKGKYYFSYSTGDTHRLCYATGDNPYGPFTYQGVILTPVSGWTTHHAIVEYHGKWYLFHHDCVPSGGKTWLRSLKVCELVYDPEGRIITIEGGRE